MFCRLGPAARWRSTHHPRSSSAVLPRRLLHRRPGHRPVDRPPAPVAGRRRGGRRPRRRHGPRRSGPRGPARSLPLHPDRGGGAPRGAARARPGRRCRLPQHGDVRGVRDRGADPGGVLPGQRDQVLGPRSRASGGDRAHRPGPGRGGRAERDAPPHPQPGTGARPPAAGDAVGAGAAGSRLRSRAGRPRGPRRRRPGRGDRARRAHRGGAPAARHVRRGVRRCAQPGAPAGRTPPRR